MNITKLFLVKQYYIKTIDKICDDNQLINLSGIINLSIGAGTRINRKIQVKKNISSRPEWTNLNYTRYSVTCCLQYTKK